jgi:hypothetical protein
MEVRIEAADGQTAPEDTYLSFRIGCNQKQARFADKRKFQFPDPGDDRKRFGRVEVFRRVGAATVDFSNFNGEFDDMVIPCKDLELPLMKLRIAVTANGRIEEEIVAKSMQKAPKVRQRLDEAQQYMKLHQLDELLAQSLRSVIQQQPADPHNYLSGEILRRGAKLPSLPLEVTALPASSPPAPGAQPMRTDSEICTKLKQLLTDAASSGSLEQAVSEVMQIPSTGDTAVHAELERQRAHNTKLRAEIETARRQERETVHTSKKADASQSALEERQQVISEAAATVDQSATSLPVPDEADSAPVVEDHKFAPSTPPQSRLAPESGSNPVPPSLSPPPAIPSLPSGSPVSLPSVSSDLLTSPLALAAVPAIVPPSSPAPPEEVAGAVLPPELPQDATLEPAEADVANQVVGSESSKTEQVLKTAPASENDRMRAQAKDAVLSALAEGRLEDVLTETLKSGPAKVVPASDEIPVPTQAQSLETVGTESLKSVPAKVGPASDEMEGTETLKSVPANASPDSDEIPTQAQTLEMVGPTLLQEGMVYKKTGMAFVKPATPGQVVETVLSGKVETTNIAKEGDWLVRANTAARERYLLPDAKFRQLYLQNPVPFAHHQDAAELEAEGFKAFVPCGRIIALQADASFIAQHFPKGKFIAVWGAEMCVEDGDFLAAPMPPANRSMPNLVVTEVYRIEKDAFNQTYMKDSPVDALDPVAPDKKGIIGTGSPAIQREICAAPETAPSSLSAEDQRLSDLIDTRIDVKLHKLTKTLTKQFTSDLDEKFASLLSTLQSGDLKVG